MAAGAGLELSSVRGADQLADDLVHVDPVAGPCEIQVEHDLVQHDEVGVTRVVRVCVEVVAHLDKAIAYKGTPGYGLDAESCRHEEPVEHI